MADENKTPEQQIIEVLTELKIKVEALRGEYEQPDKLDSACIKIDEAINELGGE